MKKKYSFVVEFKYIFPPPPVSMSLAKSYTKKQNYKIYGIYRVTHAKMK